MRSFINTKKGGYLQFFLTLTFMLLLTNNVYSNNLNYENLYINPHTQKPEVIIFYNSANTCETCNYTINQIIKILKENYSKKILAYLININTHPSFIKPFKLEGPLNLVVIRISDNASFGYQKISNPQSSISDLISFKQRIIAFIDNFLSFPTKN